MAANSLTTEFTKQLAPTMKARGYRKTGATWHRSFDKLIQVFNIQKSQWGNQFYLNVGVYLRDLGDELNPTEYRCHVRCRAEHLLSSADFTELHQTLNFDSQIEKADRYQKLNDLIERSALHWFDVNCTIESLGNELSINGTKGFLVFKDVPKLLGLK